MFPSPSIAVVIEGGLVQTTIVEGWPGHLPLPCIVVVDYDDENAAEDELTEFSIGDEIVDALCHVRTPVVYESLSFPELSPRAVLAALGEPTDAPVQSPLQVARRIRREVLDLKNSINRYLPPDSGDYNKLHALIIAGLAELISALGDTSPSAS